MGTLLWLALAVLLASPSLPPQVLNNEVNDPGTSAAACRYRVEQFFRWQVYTGMRVSELGRLLNNPAWLKDGDVEVYYDGLQFILADGCFPMPLKQGEPIFCIYLPSAPGMYRECIYLRLSGVIDRYTFIHVLGDKKLNPEADPYIREIRFGPFIIF
jgi:hypothetical protein